MKMNWFDIAKIRLEALKVSQDKLAEHLGVTKGAVNHWLNDRRQPTLQQIGEIFDYLNVKEASLNSDGTFSVDERDIRDEVKPQYFYPLYAKVSAGSFNEVGSYTEDDADKMVATTVKASVNAFWLVIEGNSMTAPEGTQPSFPEGMLILVDPALRESVKNKDFVVAGLDSDQIVFKRYSCDDSGIWLEPLNVDRDRYKPIELTEGSRIIGKVVKAQWPEETFG